MAARDPQSGYRTGGQTVACDRLITRSDEPIGLSVVPSGPQTGAVRRFAFGKRLVGRSREMARLEEALSAAANGSPHVLLITGDAGVGKTRLVCDFIEHATEAGALVLAGWCVDLSGGGLPYGPVVEALRGWVHDAGEDVVRSLADPPPPDLAGLLPGSLGLAEHGSPRAVSGLEQSRLAPLRAQAEVAMSPLPTSIPAG